MAHKYCGGQVPAVTAADLPSDHVLGALGNQLAGTAPTHYEHLAFSQVCQAALDLARAGNKYLDVQAPWKRYKQGEQAAVEVILYTVLESVRQAAYWLSPIVPHLSTAIYAQLGMDFGFAGADHQAFRAIATHGQWGILPGGQTLADPQPVFRKLELSSPTETKP
jgi:methionyl-tRNA synthetase